jgi:hypothetical protein
MLAAEIGDELRRFVKDDGAVVVSLALLLEYNLGRPM